VRYKFCNTCKQDKDVDSFGIKKGKGGKLYLRGLCKSCHTEYNLISRKKAGRKTSPKTAQRSRERALDYYYKYKNTPGFKSKVCACAANHRSVKLKATPQWLTKPQAEQINNFYWLAKDLKAVSGQDYHVDHIVPLQGKNVCGLHVPWNLQVLPSDINLSKGNRYADDA